MKGILNNLVISVIHMTDAIITLLLTRWMMELSTVEKDIKWLKKQKVYQEFSRLKFYRGRELIHQIRARRILAL
jgi:hypothetical protein